MKKFVLGLFLVCGSLCAHPTHSPELTAPLNAIYQMEETKRILETVESQGPLNIKAAYFGTHACAACWYPDERTICINYSNLRSYGSVIRSVIFELHNALDQKNFDYLDNLAMQGQISRSDYVKSVEQMEYESARKTLALVKKGVQQGIFPEDAAHWPVPPSFSEHLRMQIESGHSQAIANLYDQLRNYHLAQR